MAMSPAQAKMAARAAALATEQAKRAEANQVYQTQQAGLRDQALAILAQQQQQRAQQAPQVTATYGGSGLEQTPFEQRAAAVDAASSGGLYGSGLTTVPLADRQAQINAAQGGPAAYYGQELVMTPLPDRQAAINREQQQVFGYVRPQGPVNPAQMRQPQRAPGARTGGPGAVPQMARPQPRGPVAPPARPEPSLFQQALQYAKPVTQGLGALGSLFSLF